MFEIDPNTPGLNEAAEKLHALMAQEATPAAASAPASVSPPEQHAAPTEPSANTGDVPTVPGGSTPAVPPAEAATPKTPTTETSQTPAPNPAPEPDKATEKAPSRYEKEAERLPRSWKEFNARKDAWRAEQEKHEAALKQREAEIARREAETADLTPEQVLGVAGQRRAQAAQLSRQAEAAEDAGKFDEAKQLQRQAQRLTDTAEEAEAYAAELQKSGPSQRQQQLEAQRREWTIKAGIDFPDLVKPQSELGQRVKELLAGEPRLQREPSGLYWAARLAQAELHATLVPGLRSQLEKAQARVRELEAATSPGSAGVGAAVRGPASFAEMSDAQKEDFLMRQAREIGHL